MYKRSLFSTLLNSHTSSLKLRIGIQIRNLNTKMTPPKSWLPIPENSEFSLANIPFGIIRSKYSDDHRPAIPIGDYVLDLKAFSNAGGFSGLSSFLKEDLSVFNQTTLNDFAALGQKTHETVRKYVQEVFSESTSHPEVLKDHSELQKAALLPKHETKNLLPMKIGDYTDFYAGYNHAFNAG
jgi:fumarylacetoacetase